MVTATRVAHSPEEDVADRLVPEVSNEAHTQTIINELCGIGSVTLNQPQKVVVPGYDDDAGLNDAHWWAKLYRSPELNLVESL